MKKEYRFFDVYLFHGTNQGQLVRSYKRLRTNQAHEMQTVDDIRAEFSAYQDQAHIMVLDVNNNPLNKYPI